MTPEGLKTFASPHGPDETMARLIEAVVGHGMEVMSRIDHAKAAADAGLALRATAVLTFGNPRAGTGVMAMASTMGIDLPLRALVWQDAAGQTWLSCNDPAWLAARHGLAPGQNQAIGMMADALASVARQATGPNAKLAS